MSATGSALGSTTAASARRSGADVVVLAAALALLLWPALRLAADQAWSSIGLLAVSAALGWVFLTESFGYTGAFRAWLVRRDGSGLAAGLVVAMVAALVIVPVAALRPGYSGYIAPLSLPLLAGAAMFGLGMQLGNGCASGTLYAAGGGSRRMWVVLPFFCMGGVIGTLLLPAAGTLPALQPVNLAGRFGPWGGLAATLALTAAVIALVLRGGPRPDAARLRTAALIGGLAALVFLLSGQPWGVTTGLTLWGAKIVAGLGFDLAHTTYWSWDGPRQSLAGSILQSPSSLADIGMILGATAAAAWRGSFRRQPWPAPRALVGAAVGGLLMGIGARLSFGCNIGALVGGIASGSLHGFVWFFAALAGTWLGIRVRPVFGLSRG